MLRTFILKKSQIDGMLLHVHMDVSKNGGTQQPWVFLLKMIILGCFGGTPIFGNIHILETTILVIVVHVDVSQESYFPRNLQQDPLNRTQINRSI